jgi:hypothetical protein
LREWEKIWKILAEFWKKNEDCFEKIFLFFLNRSLARTKKTDTLIPVVGN